MIRKLAALMLALAVVLGGLSVPTGGASAAGGPVVGSYSRVYDAGYLRMRTGPGLGYAIRMNMKKGEIVRVLAGPYNRYWYKVSYRGVVGYSHGAYLWNTGLVGGTIRKYYYKVIVISLPRQQLEAYQGGKLQLVTAITTGRPELPTPTGAYQIMAKYSPYTFISPWPKGSPYYYPPSKASYAMRFRWGGYYIHDAPWRPYYGYGTNYGHYDPDGVWRTGSHGCVNVPLWAESWLYRWAGIGTWVRVVNW